MCYVKTSKTLGGCCRKPVEAPEKRPIIIKISSVPVSEAYKIRVKDNERILHNLDLCAVISALGLACVATVRTWPRVETLATQVTWACPGIHDPDLLAKDGQ